MEHVHQLDGEQSYVSVGGTAWGGSGQRIPPDLPPMRTRHLDPNFRAVQVYTFAVIVNVKRSDVSCCRCARPDGVGMRDAWAMAVGADARRRRSDVICVSRATCRILFVPSSIVI